MNRLRLKWKIFGFLLGFCALLLIILWLFQTVLLNDMYKFIRKQELSEVISEVERQIENPELHELLLRIGAEKDITVTPTREFVPPPTVGFEAQGRRGGQMPETITETREFTLENGQTVSLTFYALVAPVSATVTTLRMQLYFVTGIMIVLSVILAIVIARRVSSPIEEISQSAAELAKGNYGTHFSGKGFREILDLSETLNTAAAELGRVESLRRELMANVSHDLRTPLSLIYSYAELMSDFPGEITPEQTKVIMDETRRMTSLVNDVLDISRLENEAEGLRRARYSLTRSVSDTVSRMAQLLKAEGYEIYYERSGDVFVDADETKIDRAFYNLLINAVNYSGDSRRIAVTQTVSGGRVRVAVTDEGEGVAEGELPFIWDRYYKSGKAHKRALTGTGLGLSIVKKIIEQHGGSCGVASEVGRGSTFWFELEAAD